MTLTVGSSESFESIRSEADFAPTAAGSNSIATTRFALGPSTDWPVSLAIRNCSAFGPVKVTLVITSGLLEPRLVIVIDRGAVGPRAMSRFPNATTAGATLISGPGTGKLIV